MPYSWFFDPFMMLNEVRQRHAAGGRESSSRSNSGVFPAVNIYDNGDAFLVRAELPGLEKDKLEIETKDNRVSIRGERSCTADLHDVAFHRRERDMGTFHRVISLPQHVDSGKTTATYKNGILEIQCPRAETSKSRRVQIA